MTSGPAGVRVTAPLGPGFDAILTTEALSFVSGLDRAFRARRRELLDRREQRQLELDTGRVPGFLPETRAVREGEWRIDGIPEDLRDRRVEITGPVDRKMIINALNSGASVYMADFEDSHAPTWEATVQGQINLRDAVNGDIRHSAPGGKEYRLAEKTAVLMVRPRGWHLDEKHLLIDGVPVSGGIFDFGLYLFHNAVRLRERGTGPYFYLPKLESHLEARLWNDIFLAAQDRLSIPRGTIKATVLIETILAAFEMDEILHELRDHAAGLNCGRWDYIFSMIKRLRGHPEFIFPDRARVTMAVHCMHSYSLLAIKTCHRRGVHAIGGMAAQIPIKGDAAANEEALAKVRADKQREARDGHDGTWVAHPGLVAVAREEFDRHMRGPNQIHRLRDDVTITAEDLLAVPEGAITEEGLRTNVRVGVQYLEAWLRGSGCVPLYHLMEDAATAEISRAQVWQWIHHPKGILDDGRKVTLELFRRILDEEMAALRRGIGEEAFEDGKYAQAASLFSAITSNEHLEEFLTLRAYEHLD